MLGSVTFESNSLIYSLLTCTAQPITNTRQDNKQHVRLSILYTRLRPKNMLQIVKCTCQSCSGIPSTPYVCLQTDFSALGLGRDAAGTPLWTRAHSFTQQPDSKTTKPTATQDRILSTDSRIWYQVTTHIRQTTECMRQTHILSHRPVITSDTRKLTYNLTLATAANR